MELLASDVVALLRALAIRRAGFAGLSMGGYVALELYRQAPSLFRGLALCDTKAAPDTEAAKATREQFAQDAVAKGSSWVAGEFTPKLLRPEPDPAIFAQVRALIESNAPDGVAAAQRGMARRIDSVPTLPRIRCPTLVVVGEQDRLTPPADAQRIAQSVRGARMVTIPNAGHLPNLESPAAFNAALSQFFAGLA